MVLKGKIMAKSSFILSFKRAKHSSDIKVNKKVFLEALVVNKTFIRLS